MWISVIFLLTAVLLVVYLPYFPTKDNLYEYYVNNIWIVRVRVSIFAPLKNERDSVAQKSF
ncbi:hypothetical protein, partial [Chryseobacterium sp. SN22]|uniref:hypothetical protein n=1 Tax=Chryseobacterium sp. SN22 TaxID=2606431 RepID=UPI001E2B1A6D